MAVGDDAAAAGLPLVPGSGTGGEVKNGYVEINRTRDQVAHVMALIPTTWPIVKGGTGASEIQAAKVNLGFSYGTDAPTDVLGGTVDGNVYFKIVG